MTQEEFFNRYKYDRTKDRIGGGGFGNVYKVFDTIENETVALKIAEVRQGEENLSLKKEVELASTMERHVNIARYTVCHRFDLPNGHFDFGILQYYPLGNLSQLVKSKKLSYEEKEQIAKGVISGIKHLHSKNVVHRDLKSANILIAQGYQGEYVPKIADFGLSKQFAQNENSYFSNSFAGGSLLYVAPEQLEGKELRKNVDLWSLGVVLYELFVGETPFRAKVDDGTETARAEIIQKIRSASIPSSVSNIPAPWQEVIKVCLVTNPAQRIKSIEDVKGIMKDSNYKISHEATQPEFDKSPRQGSDLENGKKTLEKVKDLEESKNESPAWLWILSIVIFLSVIVWLWSENLFENENSKENTEIIEKIPASEEDVWQNALSNKTESAYTRYLFLYPDGKYAKEAKKRVKKIDSKKNETSSTNLEKSPQKIIEEISSSMVKIPGGSFIMGCTNEQGNDCNEYEKPAHLVKINSFFLCKFELTQSQWSSIMNKKPSYFKACSNCPIESINPVDIELFLEKLNLSSGKKYRLPTEEEWEYAASGKQKIHKFSGSGNIDEVGWYRKNSSNKTHPVGQKKPNSFGLYDMTGNVYEICQNGSKGFVNAGSSFNFYGSDYVIRGGSWENNNGNCRNTFRGDWGTDRNNTVGLRLALTN